MTSGDVPAELDPWQDTVVREAIVLAYATGWWHGGGAPRGGATVPPDSEIVRIVMRAAPGQRQVYPRLARIAQARADQLDDGVLMSYLAEFLASRRPPDSDPDPPRG